MRKNQVKVNIPGLPNYLSMEVGRDGFVLSATLPIKREIERFIRNDEIDIDFAEEYESLVADITDKQTKYQIIQDKKNVNRLYLEKIFYYEQTPIGVAIDKMKNEFTYMRIWVKSLERIYLATCIKNLYDRIED